MKQYVMLFEEFKTLNEAEILVYHVDDNAVETFLQKYQEVEPTMLPFLGGKLKNGYTKWLKWKEKNEDKLGGRAEIISSPTFGTKTFYKFDWNGVQGWAEVFQYLYNRGINESFLSQARTYLLVLLLGLSGYKGLDYMNHSVQRGLENDKQITISVKERGIVADRNYFTIIVDETQKETCTVDTSKNIVTLNTSDISNIKVKKEVRNALRELDKDIVNRNIRTHRFIIEKVEF